MYEIMEKIQSHQHHHKHKHQHFHNHYHHHNTNINIIITTTTIINTNTTNKKQQQQKNPNTFILLRLKYTKSVLQAEKNRAHHKYKKNLAMMDLSSSLIQYNQTVRHRSILFVFMVCSLFPTAVRF